MRHDDLLDCILGCPFGPLRERMEPRIAHDSALAERVARLARNLRRLLDDGWCCGPLESWKPPPLEPLPRGLSRPTHSDGAGEKGSLTTTDSR
jgi:hypothetical protein